MTEQEYIDTTNLAKLRIANYALRDMLVEDESQQHEKRAEALRCIGKLIILIEDRITTTGA